MTKKVALGVVLISLAGCRERPEVRPVEKTESLTPPPSAAPAPPPSPPPSMGMQTAPTKLGLTWEDPPSWTRTKPRSAVRAANYEIPILEGDQGKAELTVFYFGQNMGGTVDSNIDRWVGQFSDVKPADIIKSSAEANGMKQHIVEIKSGSYAADMMMMRAPSEAAPDRLPNQALLGAVVEAPTGLHFFKLTGPKKSVEAAKPAFEKMLQSMKPADGAAPAASAAPPAPAPSAH